MTFLIDVLKGMVMGIANIIPGVSGGTMAVTMGIYDKMIKAVNNLFKKLKESILILLPLFLGMGIGIVGLSFIIEYLLDKHPLQTNSLFIGLIIGGVPLIYDKIKSSAQKNGKKIFGIAEIVVFIIFFAIIVGMQLMSGSEDVQGVIPINAAEMIKLFLIGMVASATMIIPGVSGSMLLMILGYYYPILKTINQTLAALKDFDINEIVHGVIILAPFGIGVIVGVFAVAKLITFLFENFEKITYFGILGLIMASPIAILLNTDIKANFLGYIIAVVCFVVGVIIARLLGGEHDGEAKSEEQI